MKEGLWYLALPMSSKKKNFDSVEKQLELISRGCEEILPLEELKKKLTFSHKNGVPLTIKAGFDPSAPDLHLGHTVLLQKMKQFQDLGHQVYFLIGDFTGMIGDPTGKTSMRKALSREEVQENAKTYEKQVYKVLDPEKTQVAFNSQWMESMSAAQLIELSTHSTVARMLERDDFQKRYESSSPISIREFLYPLIQGYDSVQLKADVELGGTDQKFNLLMGRELQKAYDQEPQVVITMPLLEGLDGVAKMSKSLDNYIGIEDSPKDMYGKLMSMSDTLMIRYYELLSDLSSEEFTKRRAEIEEGKLHPKKAKSLLALEITSRFHSKELAESAAQDFESQFSQKKVPEDRFHIQAPQVNENIIDYLARSLPDLKFSKGDFRRLIKQGGIRCYQNIELENEQKINDPMSTAKFEKGNILKLGKRNWVEIK